MTHQPTDFVVAVVDDDPGILRSLEYLLESADYSVRLFTSGDALLAADDLRRIACVISDIDMPGMDGVELLRAVNATRPRLPVILITGYPDRLRDVRSTSGSNLRLFTKPFQSHELLEAVAEALHRKT